MSDKEKEHSTKIKVSVPGKDSSATVYMTLVQFNAWKEMPKHGMEELNCFEVLNKLTEYIESQAM